MLHQYDDDDLACTIEVVVIKSGSDFHALTPEQQEIFLIDHSSGGVTLVVAPDGKLASIEVFDSVKDAIDALRKLREVEVCGEFD